MPGIQYTLAVNLLSNFVPNEEGGRSETFYVVLDQRIVRSGRRPETRLVILESPVADRYRYAADFPQEITLLDKVTFTRIDGKNQIRSEFEPDQPGSVKLASVEYAGKDGHRFLTVGYYLLYEQEKNGRWKPVEYDLKKLS